MSNKLRLGSAPVIYRSGRRGKATTNGNNAAWLCKCSWPQPLIGRSHIFGDPRVLVECPNPSCKRIFQVCKPEGAPITSVKERARR